MAGLTDTWENKAIDFVLGTTPSANRWLALFTTAPTDSTAGTEVSGGAYVRMPVTFDAAASAATQNAATVTWAAASAGWGTVVAVGVMTAVSAGELVAYGNLTASRTVNSGDVFEILDSELDITWTD